MAPLPAPGTGQPPTGNAISDANQQAIDASVAKVVNAVNQLGANVASDCLWPPSAQVTVPIIPGVWSQSFNLGCLLSFSEARAIVVAGIMVGGLVVMWSGLEFLEVAMALPYALSVVGLKGGGKAKGAATAAEKAPATAASDVTLAA